MSLDRKIIIVSGLPGSGKSTVSKMLAADLGYAHFSGGDFRGAIAQRHGLTIDQLNDIGKTEIWTDKECDDLVKEYGQTRERMVIDSWLAWHFIPHATKLFLDVDATAAAERVFAKQRPDEAKQQTAEGVRTMLAQRYQETVDRYVQWYGVDITKRWHYDRVIDTTQLSPAGVVGSIKDYLKQKGKL